MRRSLFAEIPVVLLLSLSLSCARGPEAEVHSRSGDVREAVESFFAPLKLGMSKSEVRQHFPMYSEVLDLVHSAQLSPGGEVTLPCGANVVFAYGSDDRILSIRTSDKGIELPHGIRMGSPFSQVRRHFPGAEMKAVAGYARGMEVAPCVWLCDYDYGEEDENKGSVEWIALRSRPF